ncbi:hypothetical protein [Streptomyces sulphureus]|uniref:hypothetical protein n=1 Tax=Streptomyces sulphureus TaxID=47758 RepID=UPI00035E4260|nr:hypothetical protein [Streptomyces sulphureus]
MTTPSTSPAPASDGEQDAGWWRFALLAVLLVATAGLIVLGGTSSEAFIGAALSAAGAVYQAQRAPERRQVLALLGAVALAVAVGLAVLVYRQHSPEQVFAETTLNGEHRVVAERYEPIRVRVDADASGGQLRLVLDAQDVDTSSASCVAVGTLRFTGSDLAAEETTAALAGPGPTTVTLDLATSSHVRLEAQLDGIDSACRVSLEVKGAQFQ